MSVEKQEAARVKRDAKHKATADKGKGKRGRKRNNRAPEVGVKKKAGVEKEADVMGEASEPWMAPVALMYY